MVRRVDASGEVVVWCRTRSGCSRGRLGSKLRNRWNLEGEIVPDRSVEYCKVWGVKITMRNFKRFRNEFEAGGFMAQHGFVEQVKKRILEDRSVLPKEERDLVKETKPCIMRHSQHFAENGHGGRKSSQKEGGGGSCFWVSRKCDRLVCCALCVFFGVFGSVYWSVSLCGSLDLVVQRFSFSLSFKRSTKSLRTFR